MRSSALVGSHATRYTVPSNGRPFDRPDLSRRVPRTDQSLDVFLESRSDVPPRARSPGILDIAPYTPGKSPAPEPERRGVQAVGQRDAARARRPKAIEAFKAAADHLEDYPEGTSRVLREAIGRAYGLDPEPHHLRRRLRRDPQSARPHLSRALATRRSHTTHGFLVYPIATMATGAKNVVAPETDLHRPMSTPSSRR